MELREKQTVAFEMNLRGSGKNSIWQCLCNSSTIGHRNIFSYKTYAINLLFDWYFGLLCQNWQNSIPSRSYLVYFLVRTRRSFEIGVPLVNWISVSRYQSRFQLWIFIFLVWVLADNRVNNFGFAWLKIRPRKSIAVLMEKRILDRRNEKQFASLHIQIPWNAIWIEK